MATNPNSKKAKCPKPPADLVGEALAEWPRITQELFNAGKLEKTDRAIIVAYCSLWGTYKTLANRVAVEGAVVMQNNDLPGSTAFWREMLKAQKELRIVLSELGLTPASRGLSAAPEKMEKEELEF